jgi:hypothetical protein
MAKRALTTALFLIAALFMLSACKQQKHSGAEALAFDLARTGIIPGKPLPKKIHVSQDPFLSQSGESFGVSISTGENSTLWIDADGVVTYAAIYKPGEFGDKSGTSTVTFKTQDGKSVFGLTQEQVVQLYGEPSNKYIEDTNPPPVLYVDYCFKKAPDTYILISFGFPMKGKTAEPSDSVSASISDKEEISFLAKGKGKIYDWPKKL